MRALLSFLILAGLAAGCSAPVNPSAGDAFTASGEVIAMSGGDGGPSNACFTCHGMEGAGDGAGAPRLAGLDAGYLQKQLADYAAGLRADQTMTPIAQWLDDNDQRAVAAHYARMAPSAAAAGGLRAPAAYATGDPARGLVACAACHGQAGQGVGAGGPALAGQPAAYSAQQLIRWRKLERRNDPRGVMAAAAAPLTSSEIQAIAAWLEQQPASQAPVSDAASASAAATAAAGLAASRGTRRPGR